MAVDIRALNWTSWFTGEATPAWPDHLTKTQWDRKKGLIAKATATGIGAQLTKTEAAFRKAVDARALLGPRNIDEVKSQTDRALKFIGGSDAKKLHAELKTLSAVAKAAVATYKKSKAPGLKDTIKLCETIEKDADRLMVACNPNSLKGYLADYMEKATKRIHDQSRKLVGTTIKNMRSVPAKVLKILDDLEAETRKLGKADEAERPTADEQRIAELDELLKAFRSKAKSALFTGARDVTQPAANLRKILQADVTLTNVTMKELDAVLKVLVPYGNGNAAECSKSTYKEIFGKIKDVRKGAKLFEPIAKDCDEA